jgi:hypothetical protein
MLATIQSRTFVFFTAVHKHKIQNKTIILPVVLYGYETLPLTLREEQKLMVQSQGAGLNTWTQGG